MIEHYFLWDKETFIVNHAAISVFNGSMMTEHPATALTVKPLPAKANNVVVVCDIDERGKPHGTKYLEDHRGKTIWLKSDCNQSKQVGELGPIGDGWTLLKPETPYDEWINDAWVTNISNQYIAEYDKVDTTRRYLYSQISDPLYFESGREERQGNHDIAQALESQADAAVEKIKAENPWPKNP
ncbi:hypothetical protein [Vibrio scophthalmi]|uniref:Tail fiber assembly protein n=1 Tax=Vibrio scophthalmi LMG 19158 TaxID=870967 RepID=F9RTI0_9VIBR|nr:hypothetical protein [Vibrio scophthalmi]EGU31078.1 hypothetical protein VIS19158_06200 [Vibrio scophthalmi LMG 19158]